jgi:GPH family glycoside/pentoside/hexuronide:cation symporter
VPSAVQANQTSLFLWMLVMLLLFDTLYTLVMTGYYALFPEMFPTPAERAQVSSWRQIFAVVGYGVGVAMPPVIYANFGWEVFGILIAVLTAVSMFVSLKGMREREQAAQDEPLPVLKAFLATLKSGSFRFYFLFQIFLQFAFLLIIAAVPFFTKYVLRAPEGDVTMLLGAALLSAAVFLIPWAKLATRMGARTAIMLAVVAFAIALVPLWFVSSFLMMVAVMVAVGVGLAGLFVLPEVMLSDVIDEDALNTGARREGIFFGMQGLAVRAAGFLQAGTIGLLLTMGNYDANLAVEAQSPALMPALRAAVSLIPIAGLMVGLVLLYLYPLHGEQLRRMRSEMAVVGSR